ncbi:TetR/AcrR family transcriptional regulator [Cohnella yongneupensis]|uniref:TetR/AcrR family transcriptional regulator n=1 Tax=Cohnella yongneupensis TaxID=425006 RepID=A0ABW0QU87_9BACL
MSKGLDTRNMIIKKSAELFNRKGYTGSAMSDVMQITGLEKGGIYRHFKNKDELAFESFEFAINVLRKRYQAAYAQEKTITGKLIAVLSVYANIAEDPPLAGGCPLLNTAIDTDDTHPMLSQKAQKAMDEWLGFLESILQQGMESGDFRKDIDVSEVAVFLTSAFEGSVMMGKLYGKSQYVKMYLNQLYHYLNSCVVN